MSKDMSKKHREIPQCDTTGIRGREKAADVPHRHLQNRTSGLLARLGLVQRSANGFIKDGLQTFLCEGRAFQITNGSDFSGTVLCGIRRDDVKSFGGQLGNHFIIVTQIGLGSDQDQRNSRSVMLDFGKPLGFHVVKRRGGNNGKADKKDIGLWVRQRTKAIIIFLTGGIPKTKIDGSSINHHVCRVVVKHSGNAAANEHTRKAR